MTPSISPGPHTSVHGPFAAAGIFARPALMSATRFAGFTSSEYARRGEIDGGTFLSGRYGHRASSLGRSLSDCSSDGFGLPLLQPERRYPVATVGRATGRRDRAGPPSRPLFLAHRAAVSAAPLAVVACRGAVRFTVDPQPGQRRECEHRHDASAVARQHGVEQRERKRVRQDHARVLLGRTARIVRAQRSSCENRARNPGSLTTLVTAYGANATRMPCLLTRFPSA